MKKLKLFLENMVIYGIGGVINKLIPLLMVPLVTALMPDSAYFGLSDMSNMLINLAYSLSLMGMYDAMYRMFFEKEDETYKKTVCSTALAATFTTSAVIAVLIVLLRRAVAELFFTGTQYTYLVYLCAVATIVYAVNHIVIAPTRMQNKGRLYILVNVLGPTLSYAISIPLILKGYYTIALTLAGLISTATLVFSFGMLNRKWFSFRRVDKSMLKQMLLLALPLPNPLLYWVFNFSSKLIINSLLGLSVAGVYAVSSKLGQVSQLIYTAFAGGWQYFAFSTMHEENQVQSNSRIYEYLGTIACCVTAFVFACSGWIFRILFPDAYYEGYLAAPYLFFAPLLQMLYQVAVNQFLVIRRTWPNILILSAGALANVVLGFVLVPVLGIEGAAIATLLGYLLTNVICVLVLLRWKLMVISPRFLLLSGAMVGFVLTWRLLAVEKTGLGVALALLLNALALLLYYKDLAALVGMVFAKLRKKK